VNPRESLTLTGVDIWANRAWPGRAGEEHGDGEEQPVRVGSAKPDCRKPRFSNHRALTPRSNLLEVTAFLRGSLVKLAILLDREVSKLDLAQTPTDRRHRRSGWAA
jgi:hypothetical protein